MRAILTACLSSSFRANQVARPAPRATSAVVREMRLTLSSFRAVVETGATPLR